MFSGERNGGGGNGAARSARLELVMDLDTFQLAIGGDTMPLALGQMMLHEAMTQLDLQRRTAAAAEIRQRMQAEVEDAAIRARLSKGGVS